MLMALAALLSRLGTEMSRGRKLVEGGKLPASRVVVGFRVGLGAYRYGKSIRSQSSSYNN